MYPEIIYSVKIKKQLTRLLIHYIWTIKKINNKKNDLFITNPTKNKCVRIGKEIVNISDKPIYIYTEKGEDIRTSQQDKRHERDIIKCSAWPVRGHWRRLSDPTKRGKNALGQYIIEGLTWVKAHVCGNKELPPKQRLYIIK